ncbi:MAG TPA: hypothetical protein VN969_39990 [Streptosporangiaceae bacterium]|nr:hypothetical protein [Streptosporangiaceae bacterium]
MGVLEAVVVLESVAQEAVHADVGQPDQAQGQDQRVVLPPAQADQHGRQGRGVRRVVGDGPDAGPAQRSRPRQVRQKEEGGYQPPRLPGDGVGGEGAGQRDRSLGSQPCPGASRDGAVGRRLAGVAASLAVGMEAVSGYEPPRL